MVKDIGSRITRNSLFNLGRTLLSIPLSLFTTMYIIRGVGDEEFGVWALVGVLSSYAQLSDFGIVESLIRFIAEYKARDEIFKIIRVVNTTFTIYLFAGAAFFLLFLQFLPFVIRDILSIPEPMHDKVSYIFTISALLFFVNICLSGFNSLIIGFQRIDLSNIVAFTSVLSTTIGTVVSLKMGYGLVGLVYTNMFVTIIVIALNIYISKSLLPELQLNPFRWFDWTLFREVFSFSWRVQVTNISQILIFHIDRILISHYVGIAAVGYYEIAIRIASSARSFVAAIFTPMIPAASELHAFKSEELVTGLYRRSFKYMCMVATPSFILIAVLAHPFLTAWMGRGYEISATTLQCLAIIFLFNLLTGPGSFLLSGINKPQLSMKSSVLAGTMNIVLCMSLIRWKGYYGAVVGMGVSVVVSGLYFIYLLHLTVSGLSYKLYTFSMGRPLVAGIAAGFLATLVNQAWDAPSFLSLFVSGTIGLTFAFIILTTGRYLDDFDRKTMLNLFPFIKNSA